MSKRVSTEQLRERVLSVCCEANHLGEIIQDLAGEAGDPTAALLLAARAHELAILAVGPQLWGRVFGERRPR
jgi:hypothetical protein